MSEKVRVEARRLLQSRTARLQRLIKLEAPDVILVMEAHLLADAAEMLAPSQWHAHDARLAEQRYKRSLQLCCHEDCEEPIAWVASARTPTCPGPFHGQSCLAHALADEAEMSAEERELQGWEMTS